MFYNDAKKQAIERLKHEEALYSDLGNEAKQNVIALYNTRKAAVLQIERVEMYVNMLANCPKEFAKEIGTCKLEINDFREALKIEEENASANIKGASTAATGAAAGGAIAALGPTAAMAIATTFGTASTGTAIATLSGAAATNAALAWLGGGALAAGGGGMAAGNAILAMAGPIGWTVATVLIVGGGAFAILKNKKAANEANKAAIEVKEHYDMLLPRVEKVKLLENNTRKLKSGLDITLMVNTYPSNYLEFSEEQKLSLASIINNVSAVGKLINERID